MSQIIAGVLSIQDGQYLVQKRDNIPNIAEPGMLALWGGAGEEGETPEETAVRELLEETGLDIKVEELKFNSNYETHGRSPEFVGITIDVYIYVLNVDKEVEINCFEGEKLVRFNNLNEAVSAGEKPTEFLEKAIEVYESAR